MPFADLSTGVRLHYEEAGSGVPVVVIHGWISTARDTVGNIIDWLQADYRALGPTLRGYGQSRPPERDFPHDFYARDARDVIAFMDALSVDKAHIIGYSDGGEVALICAGTHPDRFYTVTTIGAVGNFGPELRPVFQRSAGAQWLIEDTALCEEHGITNPRAYVASWIRSMTFMVDRGGDVSLSLAPNMTMPLLLILGDSDALNPVKYGETLVDKAPNAKLVVFKETGHGVHQERPRKFQQVVGGHLRRGTSS
jgi:valacyclovir hydrolase